LFSFFAVTSLAQEKEAPAEPKENNTESSAEEKSAKNKEEEVATPKKAQRLSSKLKRQRSPNNEDSAMTLLGEYLDKESLQWLNSEHGRFLSLWQADRSGDPKGALLIIHAEGEHPAWPHTTKPLHDTLPDAGWATLAISLPAPDEHKVPKRILPAKIKKIIKKNDEEGSKDNSEDSEDSEKSNEQDKTAAIADDNKNSEKQKVVAEEPTSKTIQKKDLPSAELITEKRLESALQFLHDQGQFNLIVLGNGSGAIRAQDFIDKITPKIDNPKLKAKLERPVRAMIIVNGRNRLPTMEKTYENWFSDPEIPVLDIFTQYDYRNKIEAKTRKTLAKQKKVLVYKQVRLVSLNTEKSWDENVLSRRVRSFLDTNAVGIEVENAKVRR